MWVEGSQKRKARSRQRPKHVSIGDAYDFSLERGFVVVIILFCSLVRVPREYLNKYSLAAVLQRFNKRNSEVTDSIAPARRALIGHWRRTSRYSVLNRRQRIPRFFSEWTIFSRQDISIVVLPPLGR